ncbi:lipoma HMGIC fusion partner-like 2 protein, partial [Leptotrombidium deliense]
FNCAPFVFPLDQLSDSYPFVWKVSIICFMLAILIMMCTSIMALFSFCVRSVRRKSIFTIAGSIQSVAGLFYLLGLLLYPGGWGSRRVQLLCGNFAEAFLLGNCQLGWAAYLAFISVVATFLCALFSTKADISTSSDKIQDEILKGNRLCLPVVSVLYNTVVRQLADMSLNN